MKDCVCIVCGKKANDLIEYVELAEMEGYKDANEAVVKNEGTYNKEDNTFYCTPCYIKAGLPRNLAY